MTLVSLNRSAAVVSGCDAPSSRLFTVKLTTSSWVFCQMSEVASNPVLHSSLPLSARPPLPFRPIYLQTNLGSTPLQALGRREQAAHFLHLKTLLTNWRFKNFSSSASQSETSDHQSGWKPALQNPAKEVEKCWRGGERRRCQNGSVSVCTCEHVVHLCLESGGFNRDLVNDKESPMVIPARKSNRSLLNSLENFFQPSRVA